MEHRVVEQRLPAGYDVYMSCSSTASRDFEWISEMAIPQLQYRSQSRCAVYEVCFFAENVD